MLHLLSGIEQNWEKVSTCQLAWLDKYIELCIGMIKYQFNTIGEGIRWAFCPKKKKKKRVPDYYMDLKKSREEYIRIQGFICKMFVY